jgi:SAM-dependent methyltransferase
MPEEEWWSTFFDPERILRLFGLDGEAGDVVEFGCGYGTFTLPAARLVSGTVHALDIEPALVELVKERCAREGIGNVRAQVLDFVVEGTGLSPHSVSVALLFNILHHEEPVALMEEAFRVLIPGGHLAVIHWNYDPATPRGPALEIRPRPEQCIEWGRKAGFTFDERERVDLKPHHYGLRFRKPGGGVRRNFPIGERGEGNDKKNGS